MPEPLQQSQANSDLPPPGLDEYVSGLQKQDQPPSDLDDHVNGLLADDARQKIEEYHAGKLDLSPETYNALNKVASNGKSPIQDAGSAALATGRRIANVVTQPLLHPVDTYNKIASAASDFGSRFQKDYANRANFDPQLLKDVAGGAVSGLTNLTTSTLGLGHKIDKLSNYILLPKDKYERYQQNTDPIFGRIQHNAAIGTQQFNDLVGANPESTGSQVGSIASQAVVPIGAEAKGAEAAARIGEGLVEGGTKATGAAMRTVGTTGKVAGPAVVAGELAMHGHPILAAGELVAGYGPEGGNFHSIYGIARGINHAVIDSTFGKMDDLGKILVDSHYGEPLLRSAQRSVEDHVGTLQNDLNYFSSQNQQAAKEAATVSPENLSGQAKKIADIKGKIEQMQGRAERLGNFIDVNKVLSSAAKLAATSAVNVGEAGAIGGALAYGQSAPGDNESVQRGTEATATLGAPFAPFMAYRGMKDLRMTRGREALSARGEPMLTPDMLSGLTPAQQEYAQVMAGAHDAMGKKYVPLTPEEFQAKFPAQRPEVVPSVEGEPATEPQEHPQFSSPNGAVLGDTTYVNKEALPTGVSGHELTHHTQQIYGEMLRNDSPDAFEKIYDSLLSQSGHKRTFSMQSERDAEVGRELLRRTPIEAFYGGEDGFDVIKRVAGNLLQKLAPEWYSKQIGTTSIGAPYSREDLARMKQRMFRLGEDAAKAPRAAPSEPQATSVPQAEQTLPTATTQTTIKPLEQVVSEVDRAARPQVISMQDQQVAQNAVAQLDAINKYKGNDNRVMHALQAAKTAGVEVSERNLIFYARFGRFPREAADVVSEVDHAAKSVQTTNQVNEVEQIAKSTQQSYPTPQEAEHPESLIGNESLSTQQNQSSLPQRSSEVLTTHSNQKPPEKSSQLKSSTTENISQAQPPQNEEPSRTPTETVPQTPTEPAPERGVAGEVQAPAEPADHPDYQAIRTEAEAAKREELAGTRRKTKEQEISRAGLEAMAQVHAGFVGASGFGGKSSDLVTWRTNKYGKPSISGRKLDPNDPFHAHLLEQANLSTDNIGKLNFIESNLGKTLTADYLHAPEEEEASGVTRKAEQAESGAPERVSGEAASRRLSKSFVPTGFTFNAPSKTFEVNGFSPDKFLNNAQMLIPWAKANGLKAWKDINDPTFTTDFQNGVENHKNGYTLAGKPIEGTPLTRVKPNPDYEPHVLSKDKADLLNAMIGDTSARVVDRKQAPYHEAAKADKQILAQQNSPYWEPQTGEVNRIRAKLGDNANLLESTFETLRPELIDNLRTDAVKDEQTLRPSGFEGDRGVFAEKGTPNSTFTGAGFMPSTERGLKITKDDAQEILHKLSILRDESDLLEDYGLSKQQAEELIDSIPKQGGIWNVPQWGRDAVKSEMQDHAIVLRQIAADARSGDQIGQSLAIHRQASKFEKLFSDESFMPANPKHLDAVAKELGLRYDGLSLGGNAHQFTDDKTKSSIDVPKDATPEQIKQIIEASRKSFKDLPQFMPSTDKRAIDKAAVRFPDGRVFTDAFHPLAFSEGLNAYPTSTLAKWLEKMGDSFVETGWVDKQGNWLDRKQAQDRAEEIGQVTSRGIDEAREHFGGLGGPRGLEALNFARARKFKSGGLVNAKITKPLSRLSVKQRPRALASNAA